MTTKTQFIDLSNFQPDTVAYYQAVIKLAGIKGVVVKFTEGSEAGSAYMNPKAANQVKNGRAAGLKVSAYHFARYTSAADAQNEARWFVKNLQKLGMPADTVVVADAELKTASDYTGATSAFIDEVKALGYKTTAVYSMKSFWTAKTLDPAKFDNKWVAGYGVTDLGISNAVAWQKGTKVGSYSQDINEDYTGLFVSGSTTAAVPTVKVPAATQTTQQVRPATGTYIIKNGDTLSAIAAKYKTTVANLAAINSIGDPNKINVGQVIKVTGTPSAENTYYVQAGDSLGAIAAKFKTTVAALVARNGIKNPNLITVGQKIYLSGSNNTYTIKSGDTLGPNAAKHAISVAALVKLNGIKNANVIYPGQTIKIK